jgi:signal transduction histidine kinase
VNVYRRLARLGPGAAAVLIMGVDLTGIPKTPEPLAGVLVPVVLGPVAVAWLAATWRWVPLSVRAGVVATASLALTAALIVLRPADLVSDGWLELACLAYLIPKVLRGVPSLRNAAVVTAALVAAIVATPLRWSFGDATLADAYWLTVVTMALVGYGSYRRYLAVRRTQLVAEVRQGERLQLARDLHDLVAHHVTGIVVQAQAAREIQTSSPDQVAPLLAGIERAGLQTLDSMRQLVHVLRSDGRTDPVRPGEVLSELAALTTAFSRGGGAQATLEVGQDARAVPLSEPVRTTLIRVVQEGLTNARRHADGAPVSVRVYLNGDRLHVDLRNARHEGWAGVPVGGRGGYGLVGLRERVEAVGGRLEAGRDGGTWRLSATLPTRPHP